MRDLLALLPIQMLTALPCSPWVTLFLPVAIPPASDGWTWRKRKNWREYAMEFEDELTDEEEASEGEEF